ncbi:uncharacterized protein LOC109602263 [Aethina tumida]|uniref:uncharacterized protein LOC109602263 n=1 Tax=Aethina tumida TaxID=116153 RepID=UPI00096B1C5E|nr:uncharacterized protein LOC109602263 [Aethina tumida]
MFDQIKELNSEFLERTFHYSLLNNNNYSVVPTIIFLCWTFIILFLNVHTVAISFRNLKTLFYQQITFHWIFFYVARLWFLFIKFSRWLTMKMDVLLISYSPKDYVYVSRLLSRMCIFVIVLSVAIIPMLMLFMQELYRRDIHDFLIWLGEDRWLRSEIGISGHYLERPFRGNASENKKIRRCKSMEIIISRVRHQPLRHVRSMHSIRFNSL